MRANNFGSFMTKEILEQMHACGVIAVLRSESVKQALRVADACQKGGVNFIEITFSIPDAAAAINALKDTGAIVGAGTVITDEQAKRAIDAGAKYLVAPSFNARVLECTKSAGIPYIPGCMTVNEMQNAYEAGCKVVKLFPASEFSPSFVKAVHAPLPHLNIMPTGGINLKNTSEWIANGAFAVGVGGNLAKVVDDNYAAITDAAKQYREKMQAGKQ